MDWIEIYNNLARQHQKLLQWVANNSEKNSTPMMNLCFVVISFTEHIVDSCCTRIEDDEEICVSCFDINLVSVYTSIDRYLSQERINLKAAGENKELRLLNNTLNTCKNISGYLRNTYENLDKCGVKIVNPAYGAFNIVDDGDGNGLGFPKESLN